MGGSHGLAIALGAGLVSLSTVAGCTTDPAPMPAPTSLPLPTYVRESAGCWQVTSPNGLDTVHLTPPKDFVAEPKKLPVSARPWFRWTKNPRTMEYEAVGVYDVGSDAPDDKEALKNGATNFLSQAWGFVKVDLTSPTEWSGVPGGKMAGQVYPTITNVNAHRQDNVFWLVPVRTSRFVVAVSGPDGAAAKALADAVSPTIGSGPCP